MIEAKRVIQKTVQPEYRRIQITHCIYKYSIMAVGDTTATAKQKQIKNATLVVENS